MIIPFKIKTLEKPQTVLIPDQWFLSWKKKFWNSMIALLVGATKNWPGDKFFKTRESKFWERQSLAFNTILDIS